MAKEEKENSMRKISMILFAVLMLVVAGCGTVMSAVFHEPKYFEYAIGGIFTALGLIAFFGWPID